MDDSKRIIYNGFLHYFGNPECTKINSDTDQHSSYAVRTTSMLSENRYLLVILRQDLLPKGTVRRLKDIPWECFQVRVLKTDLIVGEYSPPKENNGLFDDKIMLVKRDRENNKVVYQCTYNPLIVELIPSKSGSVLDYPKEATLEEALNTSGCVIYFA